MTLQALWCFFLLHLIKFVLHTLSQTIMHLSKIEKSQTLYGNHCFALQQLLPRIYSVDFFKML